MSPVRGDATVPETGSWRSLLWAGAAAGLALIVYWIALDGPFVYDDVMNVTTNPAIAHPSDLPAVFSFGSRPFVNLTYALNHAIAGSSPAFYHVTNLCFHIANVFLLFVLAGHLFDDAQRAAGREIVPKRRTQAQFIAAALLAVHPLLTEAVAYVSGRAGVICTTWLLLALLCARRFMQGRSVSRHPAWWAALTVGCYALALSSKETGIMLPFLLFAYDSLLAASSRAEKRRRLLAFYLPLLLVTLAAGIFRIHSYVAHEGGEGTGARVLVWSWATQLPIFWKYVLLLFVPVSQSVLHGAHRVTSLLEPRVVLSGLAIIALLALAFRVRRHAGILALGVAWFVLLWLPSAALPFIEQMAEHRVYEASAGVFLLIGISWARLRGLERHRVLLISAQVLMIGAFATLAIMRNRLWSDPLLLWRDAAEKAPGEWAPHYVLGDMLRDRNDCQSAIPEYREAAGMGPRDARPFINLAICLGKLGRFDEATAPLHEAERLTPNDPTIFLNLGVMELFRRNPTQARQHFKHVLELDPKSVKARQNLLRLGASPEEALKLCQEIEALAPGIPGTSECIRDAKAALAK